MTLVIGTVIVCLCVLTVGKNVIVGSYRRPLHCQITGIQRIMKTLDPKRTLYWYLKIKEQLRNNEDSDFAKLFLSYVKPHHPVSSKTISRWIVETIRLAYDDKHKKIKGHFTRAIGPSWALFNGTTVRAILDAADWSKESTFTKFYLTNVDLKVLD